MVEWFRESRDVSSYESKHARALAAMIRNKCQLLTFESLGTVSAETTHGPSTNAGTTWQGYAIEEPLRADGVALNQSVDVLNKRLFFLPLVRGTAPKTLARGTFNNGTKVKVVHFDPFSPDGLCFSAYITVVYQ